MPVARKGVVSRQHLKKTDWLALVHDETIELYTVDAIVSAVNRLLL